MPRRPTAAPAGVPAADPGAHADALPGPMETTSGTRAPRMGGPRRGTFPSGEEAQDVGTARTATGRAGKRSRAGRGGARRRSVTGVLALLTLAAVALSGCVIPVEAGGGAAKSTPTPTPTPAAPVTTVALADQPAEAVLAAARVALAQAGSFRAEGEITDVLQRVELDVRDDGRGNSQGQANVDIGIGSPIGTRHVEFVLTEETRYGRGTYWHSLLDQISPDQWVAIDEDKLVHTGYLRFSATRYAKWFMETPGPLTKEPVQIINGVEAIGVTGKRGTTWIATDGVPYPVMVSAPREDGHVFRGQNIIGELRLSEFGEPVEVVEPADSRNIVDIRG